MSTLSETNPGSTQPLLVDAKAVGAMLGRCERSVWRDAAAGRIPRPIELGGSKRWRLSELQQWAAAGCPNRDTWEAQIII